MMVSVKLSGARQALPNLSADPHSLKVRAMPCRLLGASFRSPSSFSCHMEQLCSTKKIHSLAAAQRPLSPVIACIVDRVLDPGLSLALTCPRPWPPQKSAERSQDTDRPRF